MRYILCLLKIILVISLLIIPASMSGCAGNNDPQQDMQLQAAKEKESREKESEKLKKIEEQIENLFDVLGGPSIKAEEANEKKEGGQEQKSTQQQGTQQQGTQQQGTQQQGGKNQGQQEGTQKQGTHQAGKQQDSQQQAPDKWSQVGRIINNLHYQWNDLMPEAAKKGADMKLVDNFDNALNILTTTVDSKDQDKVRTSANKLYSYIPDLYSLYRVKMSPEVKRMIYYTRSIILEAENNGWQQVEKDNEFLEKSWSLFRNTLEKEQKKTEDKLDFSIYELKKVATEKNKQLTGIKGRIVLNNINELQKSFEDK